VKRQLGDLADVGRRLCVLVVDDHDVVVWGLTLLLRHEAWVKRHLVARDEASALERARRYEPHVAIVDVCLGEGSGLELCERLRAASPRTRVLLMSGSTQVSNQAARAAGASGFIPKSWAAPDVAQATRMVGLGMTVFPPRGESHISVLSQRERQVLSLLAGGATNREIADELFLSRHTVKDHTSALYRKLKVRNRAEAALHGERFGLLA